MAWTPDLGLARAEPDPGYLWLRPTSGPPEAGKTTASASGPVGLPHLKVVEPRGHLLAAPAGAGT